MFKSVVAIAVAGVLLVGCANQSFNVAGAGNAAPRVEDSQTFWVSGIGQQKSVDAAKVCGGADKVAAVNVEQSGQDVLLGIVTLGIYTPRTARVFCK